MASAATLKVDFLGDLNDLTKKFRSATTQMESFANRINRIGKQMSVALTAPITAFAGVSVRAFAKQEDAERKLASAIRATGGAVDANMARFTAFATEMQRLTVVGDETTLGLLQLATAQGLSADASERAVRNAIAMQSAFNVGAESAIRMTAALEQGDATMLRRYIPALRGVTDEAEMLAKAHEILSGAFQIAQDEALTFGGQVAQLRNAFGDFQEQVGAVIAKALVPMIERAGILVERLQAMDSEVLKVNLKFAGLVAAIGPALIGISKVTSAVRLLTVAMATNPIGAFVTALIALGVVSQVAGSRALALGRAQLNMAKDMQTANGTMERSILLQNRIKDLAQELATGSRGSVREEQIRAELDLLTEQLRMNQAMIDSNGALADSVSELANIAPPKPLTELLLPPDQIADIQRRIETVSGSIDDLLDIPYSAPELMFPPGSLGAIQNELQAVQSALLGATDPERIALYTARIESLSTAISNWGQQTQETSMAVEFLSGISDTFVNSFGQGMANLIVQGGEFLDILQNIGRLLASAAIQKAITIFLSGGLTAGKDGFFGSGGGLFGALFGRATGGQVGRGQPYMVGERGPELFVPGANGFVAPNNAISGMGASVNVTGTFRIQGTDLIATIERAKRSFR
jgi:hypothetical protein